MMDLRKITLREIEVELPDGGKCRIKELRAPRLVAIQSNHKPQEGQEVLSDEQAAGLYAELTAASVLNDKGERYLDDDKGRAACANLPWAIVSTIGKAAARLNGLLSEKKS